MRSRGSKSVRAFPEPETMRRGIFGSCKWCGNEIIDPKSGRRSTRRYWHPECVEIYYLHTRSDTQRQLLIGRDGERCWDCAASPMIWHRGEAHSCIVGPWAQGQDWAADFWSREELGELPRGFDPVTFEVIDPDAWMLRGGTCDIRRISSLEVDHEVPLWKVAHLPPDERRPYFGPDNLRLRCPGCHKAKTAREAAERAEIRRAA